MFSLKDKVVYPGHGVAIVERELEKNVAGTSVVFFKLNFLFKEMTILVPTHAVQTTGVRQLSDIAVVEKSLNELLEPPDKKVEDLDLTPSGWNKRYKNYHAKIQTGLLLEVAKIYRDLMHISQQKELSFGEKTLLQTTEDLLLQEIVSVKKSERTQVLQELRAPFKQFALFAQDGGQQATL